MLKGNEKVGGNKTDNGQKHTYLVVCYYYNLLKSLKQAKIVC